MQNAPLLSDIPIEGYFTLQQAYVIQNWAFVAGIFVALTGVYFWRQWRWVVPAIWRKLKATASPSKETTRTVAALVLVVFLFASVTAMHAQTATPVPPTSTPGLTIPINTVMTSTNSWIETFAPIAAIGIGIGVALAILGYLGRIIKGAFD